MVLAGCVEDSFLLAHEASPAGFTGSAAAKFAFSWTWSGSASRFYVEPQG